MIKEGESASLEFKETLRYNVNTKGFDKKMGHSVLKTVAAFLNSSGGVLLVGVSDDGIIKGIKRDGFKNSDKYALYFNNLFKKHVGNEFTPFVSYEIVSVGGKQVLKVDSKSSDKEVFLKDGDDEEFYIRVGPASVLVEGSKLIGYVKRRF